MKYMTFALLGLFDTDPITTGGVGGSTTTTPAPATAPKCGPCGELCHDPGNGMPHFVMPVLVSLLGDGTITRTNYTAVCSGAKSIEALGLSPAVLARLHCDGSGEPPLYDVHFDRDYPPVFNSVTSGLTVQFSPGHAPTDKAHRILVSVGSGNVTAGTLICHVTFATPYRDDSGVPVAPNVLANGAGGTQTWRAANITPYGYDLATDSGISSNSGVVCQVTVQPARV